ncbi:hypothetical protein CEXT_21391 [Caerostris extrusa]|uniref:Uncharacterized protein n=1 Tax=Caerostris extrusa TaxID=172846 RepID=A0AAV4Q9M4_CAEEX|nr:hypothetical protein CEXT_21391 [Caerostris extrusa]
MASTGATTKPKVSWTTTSTRGIQYKISIPIDTKRDLASKTVLKSVPCASKKVCKMSLSCRKAVLKWHRR